MNKKKWVEGNDRYSQQSQYGSWGDARRFGGVARGDRTWRLERRDTPWARVGQAGSGQLIAKGHRKRMKVFRLIPTDTVDPCWQASTHMGQVVVRAESEHDARDLAAFAFKAGKKSYTLERLLTESPWSRKEIVACFVAIDPVHGLAGPEEILSPQLVGTHVSTGEPWQAVEDQMS